MSKETITKLKYAFVVFVVTFLGAVIVAGMNSSPPGN